jgi:hypothetical protein
MLMRDIKSGRLVNMPENGYGYFNGLSGANAFANPSPQGMVYDGLGNPLGILPFIPLLAKAATTLLPTLLPKILPMLTGGGTGSAAGALPHIASQILPMLTNTAPAVLAPPQIAMPMPPDPIRSTQLLPVSPAAGSMPAANMPLPPLDVVPMSVQTPQGVRMVPVRVRRGRRPRRRSSRISMLMPQTALSTYPTATSPAASSLHGWAGYGRW